MPKIPFSKFASALGVLSLAILLGAGTVTAILDEGLSSSEAAGWVQALGSIAAIAAAIYIWLGDRKERRKDEQAIALVASVSMSHSAAIFHEEVLGCGSLLVTAADFNYPRETLASILERLEALPRWSVEEVHRLSALGDCALNIARAQHSMHVAKRYLSIFLKTQRSANLEYLLGMMAEVTKLLDTAEWNSNEALMTMLIVGKPQALASTDQTVVDPQH